MNKLIYVKTEYETSHCRKSNITKYNNKTDADSFIKTCLQWGIGITSCNIIQEDKALLLLKNGEAEG